jgi:hypothetical protein
MEKGKNITVNAGGPKSHAPAQNLFSSPSLLFFRLGRNLRGPLLMQPFFLFDHTYEWAPCASSAPFFLNDT